jgi:hypothetical protein
MADLLSGVFPGISGTVAACHPRINGGFGAAVSGFGAGRKFFDRPGLTNRDRERNKNYLGTIGRRECLLGPANHLQKQAKPVGRPSETLYRSERLHIIHCHPGEGRDPPFR